MTNPAKWFYFVIAKCAIRPSANYIVLVYYLSFQSEIFLAFFQCFASHVKERRECLMLVMSSLALKDKKAS